MRVSVIPMKRAVFSLASAFLAVTAMAQTGPATQWDFNTDYSPTVGPQPVTLDPGGTHSFDAATIGDSGAGVASFAMSNAGRNGFYYVQHGLEANGGGAYVNEYTVVMDVRFFNTTAGQPYIALFNTNASNNNDADTYILMEGADGGGPYGSMGIGSYGGKIYPENWNRIVIAVSTTWNRMTWYVNGVEQVITPIGGRDSTLALYTVNDTTPWFTLFGEGYADTEDYTKPGQINTLQVYGRELTAVEAAALGGPAALGAGAFVGGQLSIQSFAGTDLAGRTASISFTRGSDSETRPVALNADGTFLANTALFGAAPTRVLAKTANTLRKALGEVTIPIETGVTGLNGVLTPGDISDDNRVDLDDFLVLASQYEQSYTGDPNVVPNPDLNGDGVVNLDDFLLLAAVYETEGD